MSSTDGETARKLLRACEEAAAKLSRDKSGEALHDFRVGLRRLRTELKASSKGLGKHRRRLRELFARTGPWRDAQIEADWVRAYAGEEDQEWALAPLLRELDESLAHGRAKALPELARRFSRAARKLRRRLCEGIEVNLSGSDLRRLAGDVSERLAAVSGPDDDKRLHRARIAVKKLRYALELSRRGGARLKRLRELQGLLGDLNDRRAVVDMLATAARAGVAEPGALARAQRRAETEKREVFARLRLRWLSGRARRLARLA